MRRTDDVGHEEEDVLARLVVGIVAVGAGGLDVAILGDIGQGVGGGGGECCLGLGLASSSGSGHDGGRVVVGGGVVEGWSCGKRRLRHDGLTGAQRLGGLGVVWWCCVWARASSAVRWQRR